MPAVPRPLSRRCMTWTRPWFSAASLSAISPVPSGELSSTTTTLTPSCARMAPIIFSMFTFSLYVGSITIAFIADTL